MAVITGASAAQISSDKFQFLTHKAGVWTPAPRVFWTGFTALPPTIGTEGSSSSAPALPTTGQLWPR